MNNRTWKNWNITRRLNNYEQDLKKLNQSSDYNINNSWIVQLWVELEEIETSQEVAQSTTMIKIWKTQVNGMIMSSGNNF
jgi:hypothetical protein